MASKEPTKSREMKEEGRSASRKSPSGIPILTLSTSVAFSEWLREAFVILQLQCGRVAAVLQTRTRVRPETKHISQHRSDYTLEELQMVRPGIQATTVVPFNLLKTELYDLSSKTGPKRTAFCDARVNPADDPDVAAAKRIADEALFDTTVDMMPLLRAINNSLKDFDDRNYGNFVKEQNRLREQEIKCTMLIVEAMSSTSKEAVKNSFPNPSDYDVMIRDANLTLLVEKLYSTHRNNRSGLGDIDLMEVETEYMNIAIRNGEPVSDYHDRIVAVLRAMLDMQIPIPPPEAQARHFLRGLDSRYNAMKLHLNNNLHNGSVTFPKTLQAAYEYVCKYQALVATTPGRNEVAFLTATETVAALTPKPGKKKTSKDKSKPSKDDKSKQVASDDHCALCGKKGHDVIRCYKLADAQDFIKRQK